MSFPRYPKYKDSGVEWLGEVPEHWETVRLRHLTSIRKGRLPGETSDAPATDSDLPYLSMEYLRGETETPRYVTPSDGLLCADEADVLLLWDGSNAGEFLRARRGIVSSTIALIENDDVDRDFLFYACKGIERRIKDQTIGMGIPHVSGDGLKASAIQCPPPAEQTAIAAFLDRETAKIDGLVAEQRRLIELLKEKRQAVISHAVTKGLNPDAPMKDSGIEWLGEVPAHWEIRTIAKASTKITNGYVGPTRDILVESGTPYIQATHIKKGRVNFDDGYFVRPEWSKSHAKSILAEGDVLIVQTGAGTGDVGLVSSNEVGFNCHALIIVASVKELLSGAYLASLLQSDYGRQKLESIQTGGMHPHLNCGNVKFVEIPLPPLAEQAAIIELLDTELVKFDTLTAEAQRAIDLFQERRTALISAAVTGQIDVRGLNP